MRTTERFETRESHDQSSISVFWEALSKVMLRMDLGDFPGGPVVGTSPSNAWGVGSIPGRGAKIPYALWLKKQNINNRSNSVTNSVKTLKLVHVKMAQMVKHLPTMQETQVQSLGREDPLEKEMATHSSTLAWKTPQMEEPGRLQSTGSQRVRHD